MLVGEGESSASSIKVTFPSLNSRINYESISSKLQIHRITNLPIATIVDLSIKQLLHAFLYILCSHCAHAYYENRAQQSYLVHTRTH